MINLYLYLSRKKEGNKKCHYQGMGDVATEPTNIKKIREPMNNFMPTN